MANGGEDVRRLLSGGLKVRKTMCATCIYRPDSTLDLAYLEDQCRDRWGFLVQYRICHYHDDTCCRGFWQRHADACTPTQIASRLGVVVFTDEEALHADTP